MKGEQVKGAGIVSESIVTFEDAVDWALSVMRDVMIRKQRDYGSGNISAFGEFGVLVRASDKVHRLKNLLEKAEKGQVPQNEPLFDSWLDLANYGLIGMLLQSGLWGLPMEEELSCETGS
ncbi:MAG: hypothetical protein KM310_06975 [Clostridiales bacterium]|nr:hypothetical protein [Clostridiales bacterium]